MGEETKIEWTRTICALCGLLSGYTFNLVIGCSKVSPACQFCYAESMAKRRGWAKWGRRTARKIMSAAYWRKPLTWNYKAAQCPDATHRPKVFCSSLADVFEDHPTVTEQRARLWPLIRQTPRLDWLLLTKRPERIKLSLPDDWGEGYANVWLGTTAETQEWAERRVPHLLDVPAAVRFLSCEPLLGPIDLTSLTLFEPQPPYGPGVYLDALRGHVVGPDDMLERRVDWVIGGYESGGRARPGHPDWARRLRDDCASAEVPFFFKQWGNWLPIATPRMTAKIGSTKLIHPDGRVESATWSDVMASNGDVWAVQRMAKNAAGRTLDGRTWDEMPEGRACV